MIWQLGMPTLFLTLSMSELHDERLLRVIESLRGLVKEHCHVFADLARLLQGGTRKK